MQHAIPLETLGPQGPAMAEAVGNCVHCGFCLATCPTYRVLGEEPDSPRGRIVLMKEQLEGRLALDPMLVHIDRCLGCLACVTACPSGVEYGELLAPFRARAEPQRERTPLSRAARLVVKNTLPYPSRFRAAALAGRWAKPANRALPAPLAAMLDLLPGGLPRAEKLPEVTPAMGRRRARVALLLGCVQQVLAPQINAATVRVLARNGVEVVIPPGQGCCGSLSFHIGEMAQGQELARNNLRRFPQDVDAVIVNAAGCGSGIREYGLLFAGEADHDAAAEFAARAQDVSLFLHELGLIAPPPLPAPVRLAYHDACHLAHAQRITAEPRSLLRAVPGVTLLEVPEGELCCGSAGTYNIEQPELARQIGERKARNIRATGAQAVAAGNIGCIVQIRNHLAALGAPLPVWHTVEVLDIAYRAAST